MIYNPSHKASTISNYSLLLDWQQRWFIKLIKTDVFSTCSENNQPDQELKDRLACKRTFFLRSIRSILCVCTRVYFEVCAFVHRVKVSGNPLNNHLSISSLKREISLHLSRPLSLSLSLAVPEMSEIKMSGVVTSDGFSPCKAEWLY